MPMVLLDDPWLALSQSLQALNALITGPRAGRLSRAQTAAFRADLAAFCARHPAPPLPIRPWRRVSTALRAVEAQCYALRLELEADLEDPLTDPEDAARAAELRPLHEAVQRALFGRDADYALPA